MRIIARTFYLPSSKLPPAFAYCSVVEKKQAPMLRIL